MLFSVTTVPLSKTAPALPSIKRRYDSCLTPVRSERSFHPKPFASHQRRCCHVIYGKIIYLQHSLPPSNNVYRIAFTGFAQLYHHKYKFASPHPSFYFHSEKWHKKPGSRGGFRGFVTDLDAHDSKGILRYWQISSHGKPRNVVDRHVKQF